MLGLPHWPRVAVWPQRTENNLEVMQGLLDALGNPHHKTPPVIHVAGTNGKGSTIAILKSIFKAAGYKSHSYTSPHLLEFNERINLAGENISDFHLFELLETVRMKAEELKLEPGFFEGVTIAAFLAFSSVPADILFLETGLGGRLDPTNIIEKPALTIITPISFDHMDHLGHSLPEIANEKAGIIKRGVPCVISLQQEEIYPILLQRCEELNSPAFCYEYDYMMEETEGGILYHSQKYSLALPRPSLPGKHQYLNAASACAAALLASNILKISGRDISAGIEAAVWPGRIEKIEWQRYSHLADRNIEIYLDGAHNEAGAQVLSEWIREYISGPVYMIIGMTRNRDIEKFCQNFRGLITEGRAVKVLSEPSSYHPDILTEKFQQHNFRFQSAASLTDSIKEISNLKAGKKATLIITGSLFLISDFYRLIN